MDEELQPNWELLDKLMTAPDGQLDTSMVKKLKVLKGKTAEEVKTGLHEILDISAHCALASTFIMKVMDMEWTRLGGKVNDPAPWQKQFER